MWDEKKTLEYPRDETQLVPLQQLLEIKTWWTEWKSTIDKIDEWVAWRGVNVKVNKESFALLKPTINISKEDLDDYN
jgi:hypothetical protein